MLRRPSLLVLASALAVLTGVPSAGHAKAKDPAKPVPAWRAEKNILEVGGYMGAFFPAADHGLYGVPVTGQKPIKTGFSIGLRLAYLPLRFVGIEVEGGAVPTKLVQAMDAPRVTLFGVRGHLILQLPTRLALFVVGGGGISGVSSAAEALGKNVDGTLHVGGGLKYYLTPKVVLRIDGRDVIGPSFSSGMPGGATWTHHGELTFGASFVLGRKTTGMPKRTR